MAAHVPSGRTPSLFRLPLALVPCAHAPAGSCAAGRARCSRPLRHATNLDACHLGLCRFPDLEPRRCVHPCAHMLAVPNRPYLMCLGMSCLGTRACLATDAATTRGGCSLRPPIAALVVGTCAPSLLSCRITRVACDCLLCVIGGLCAATRFRVTRSRGHTQVGWEGVKWATVGLVWHTRRVMCGIQEVS